MGKKRGPIDFPLFIVIILLLAIGVNMVFSASMYQARQIYNDSYHWLKRQILWAGLGVVAMFIASNINYKILRNKRLIFIGMIVTMVLLVVVLFLPPVKGARRWLGIGGAGIQPSEVAKLMLIIYLSDSLTRKGENIKSFKKGVIPTLLIAGIFAGLIVVEPNLSTCIIVMTVALLLLFAGGAKLQHLAMVFLIGIVGIIFGIILEPYRMRRLLAFVNPWADPLDTGYQAIQSLYALGSGGPFGYGFGMSRQKQYYIPEAQNDFIFAILGEELGFLGVVCVILLFAFLVWRGLKIALNCKDKFGSLLAAGITALIAVQSSINFLVVSSFMPITGVTLPLISYGGSSLLFTMASLGLLLGISRHSKSGAD